MLEFLVMRQEILRKLHILHRHSTYRDEYTREETDRTREDLVETSPEIDVVRILVEVSLTTPASGPSITPASTSSS